MSKVSEIEKKLEKIKQEVLVCQKCPLYKERIKDKLYPVIGQGNHQAKIMFIGEAPGLNEAKTGRPFCGAAGKILDELLEFVGLKRQEVYIANILKCRPPGNRNPGPKEIEACVPYLERQIELIKPEIICALGNYSTAFILEKFGLSEEIQGISKIHGKVFDGDGKAYSVKSRQRGVPLLSEQFNRVKIIPLYHPAVVVYNQNMKEVLKKDFHLLKSLSNKIEKKSGAGSL